MNWTVAVAYSLVSIALARPTAMWKDSDTNLISGGYVYHDSHCDMEPGHGLRSAHLYCSAIGKLSLASLRGR